MFVTWTNFLLSSSSLHTAVAVEGLQVVSCQIMHGLQSSLGESKVWEQCEQAQPATSTNCWCGRWNTKAEGGRGEWKCVLVWKRLCKNKYAWACSLGMYLLHRRTPTTGILCFTLPLPSYFRSHFQLFTCGGFFWVFGDVDGNR